MVHRSKAPNKTMGEGEYCWVMWSRTVVAEERIKSDRSDGTETLRGTSQTGSGDVRVSSDLVASAGAIRLLRNHSIQSRTDR